jgi:hypothetical protein
MPDYRAAGADAYSIAPQSAVSNSQPVALSEVSPQDKPWDKHRAFTDRVEGFYRGSEFNRYSERIHYCSELLEFGLARYRMTNRSN